MPTPLEELRRLHEDASASQVPLYQYLGGPTRTKARVLSPLREPTVDGVARARERGARAFLLAAAGGIEPVCEAIRAADGDFAVRCAASMRADAALALARSLQALEPLWISHPDPRVVRRIARAGRVPVGTETMHPQMLKEEIADLLCIDLEQTGIRATMQLAALAETHYCGVVLLNCARQPWLNAGLHLAAALPNFLALESEEQTLQDGYLPLRNEAGIGVRP